MKKIVIIGDKNIYIKRLTDYLINESENVLIYIICRNRQEFSEHDFNPKIQFYHFKNNYLFVKILQFLYYMIRIKPDLVYTHYLVRDSIIPSIFKNIFKYKYIIGVTGSDINIYSINIINKLFQFWGLKYCTYILILSNYFENIIVNNYSIKFKNKLRLISWGIEFNYFNKIDNKQSNLLDNNFIIPQNKKIILSYRNVSPLYNQITLIKSIPLILKKNPNVYFIIICGYFQHEYLQQLKDLTNNLNIDNSVKFIEQIVSRDTIKNFLNLSEIMINIPLLDGLPATLLEAMSTRTIPICTNLVNYSSFFHDDINGFLINNYTSFYELSETINKALSYSNAEKEDIIINNHNYIKENQDWDIQKLKLKKLFLGS